MMMVTMVTKKWRENQKQEDIHVTNEIILNLRESANKMNIANNIVNVTPCHIATQDM